MHGAEAQLIESGWAALPAEYRMPAETPSLAEARAWCKQLTESHYENFHVASWFLPARLREHFHAIYAYCRVSDDLGDEVGDVSQSRALLDLWERQLKACYGACYGAQEPVEHPVFVALRETIRACSIPIEPFRELLVAFRQDQQITRFATMAEVMEYCRYSANPVGRLVLYVAGYADSERFALSDFTCSALQLANFWQDVREDYARGRIYLPRADMERFGVDEPGIAAGIAAGCASPEFLRLMRYEVEQTRTMFARGMPLIGTVDRELAVDLELFSRGGLEILGAIERQAYDVLRQRPVISRSRKAALLLRAFTGMAADRLRRRSPA